MTHLGTAQERFYIGALVELQISEDPENEKFGQFGKVVSVWIFVCLNLQERRRRAAHLETNLMKDSLNF